LSPPPPTLGPGLYEIATRWLTCWMNVHVFIHLYLQIPIVTALIVPKRSKKKQSSYNLHKYTVMKYFSVNHTFFFVLIATLVVYMTTAVPLSRPVRRMHERYPERMHYLHTQLFAIQNETPKRRTTPMASATDIVRHDTEWIEKWSQATARLFEYRVSGPSVGYTDVTYTVLAVA
jgi:hypothetical protein